MYHSAHHSLYFDLRGYFVGEGGEGKETGKGRGSGGGQNSLARPLA